MLISRVTTALVKFLAPVSSSSDGGLEFDKTATQELPQDRTKAQDSERSKVQSQSKGESAFEQKKKQHDSKIVLRLVQNTPQSANPEEDDLLKDAFQGPETVETAEASKFLSLFSLFQKQKSQLQQKMGNASYKTSIGQKRSGRFKKGSILDTHID